MVADVIDKISDFLTLPVPRLMKSFLPQPEAPAAAAAAGVPPAGAAKGRRNNNASRIEEIKEETKKEN
jgi:ribosomal protein L12E/L44/L45/RPP1/RPP2